MDTKGVLDHHVQAFRAGDVDELLKDYSVDCVVIGVNGPVRGLEALRRMITELLDTTFKPGTFELTLDATHVEGEVAYIAYHASCAAVEIPFATETYIVRNGKIVAETYAAKIEPK